MGKKWLLYLCQSYFPLSHKNKMGEKIVRVISLCHITEWKKRNIKPLIFKV